MSVERRIVNYVLEYGTKDNFFEVVLGASRRFSTHSSNTILEIVRETYNLLGWRNDIETAHPALLLNREARWESWNKYLAGELEKVTAKRYRPSKRLETYLTYGDEIMRQKENNYK